MVKHSEKRMCWLWTGRHDHCPLWVKDATVLHAEADEKLMKKCTSLWENISMAWYTRHWDIPVNCSLVLKLQPNSHSSCCRKHILAKCWFIFPKLPTTGTIMAREPSPEEVLKIDHFIVESKHRSAVCCSYTQCNKLCLLLCFNSWVWNEWIIKTGRKTIQRCKGKIEKYTIYLC